NRKSLLKRHSKKIQSVFIFRGSKTIAPPSAVFYDAANMLGKDLHIFFHEIIYFKREPNF
ncbi:hypothetical protein, partial [Akkermansia sp.]